MIKRHQGDSISNETMRMVDNVLIAGLLFIFIGSSINAAIEAGTQRSLAQIDRHLAARQ